MNPVADELAIETASFAVGGEVILELEPGSTSATDLLRVRVEEVGEVPPLSVLLSVQLRGSFARYTPTGTTGATVSDGSVELPATTADVRTAAGRSVELLTFDGAEKGTWTLHLADVEVPVKGLSVNLESCR